MKAYASLAHHYRQSANLDKQTLVMTKTLHQGDLTDFFSLYDLFTHFGSCGNTQENCFSQISSISRIYVRIIYKR